MRPICVPCGVEMHCEKNERGWLTCHQDGSPYQLWSTDEYKCPKCEYKILTGFGRRPVKEHFQNGFHELVQHWNNHSGVVEEQV